MPIPKQSILFLLISLTYTKCMHETTSIDHTNNHCPTRICTKSDPNTRKVRFPFRIRNDSFSGSCGYPGFDLFCKGNGKLSIELPNSGVFYVAAIDYVKQELLLNDPSNCLSKRLLSLNHSINIVNDSPFVVVHELSYKLYNCSNDDFKSFTNNLKPIECLSGLTYGVVAVPNDTVLSLMCDSIGMVQVPVGSEYEEMDYSDLGDDIRIGWVKPKCGECFQRGGLCGFKPNSSFEVGCFNLPHRGLPRSVTIGIGLAIITPMALFFICVTYFSIKSIRNRRRTNDASIMLTPMTTTPQPPQPQPAGEPTYRGLDRSIIESFPKMILDESMNLPNVEDKSCSICLNEYLPKEILRKIPPCGHCFHALCIDEWLLLNAACPICRNYSSSSHFSENSERA